LQQRCVACVNIQEDMKRFVLALGLVLTISGCSQRDQDRAKKKAEQAAREVKQAAHQASTEIQHDAKEFNKRAGPEIQKAGRELKRDAAKASQKLKEGAGQLRREAGSDPLPRKEQ
jgi:hypothetical protein